MPTFRVFPVTDSSGSLGWTGTGTPFWAQIDDDPDDGDTSYIQAGGDSVPTRNQSFIAQTVGFPDAAIVQSVALSAMAKRVDAGQNVFTFELRLYLRIGSGRYLVASQSLPGPSAYAAIVYSSTTSPATGLAWLSAEVSRLVPEIEVSQSFDNAPRVGAFGRFTQFYADIAFISPTWTNRVDLAGAQR